jgi:cobalt-zinc-cadmium efflux system membrane fusion protein
MMKRKGQQYRLFLLLLVALLLGAMLFIAGCNRKGSPVSEKTAATEAKSEAGKKSGEVMLSQEKVKTFGIEVSKVVLAYAPAQLTATAIIELNADKTTRVSSRVTGRIVRLLVSQGNKVRAGQTLAFMDSVELDQIWSEYAKTKGRYELASRTFQREATLFEKKVAPEKDVHKARQELGEAEADLTFSKERFRLLGTDIASVESQRGTGGNGRPLIPISSLVGGTIIEKSVTQGETISPDKVLFTVADLSILWALIDIYEKDLSRVAEGTQVKLSVTAFPDRQFQGKVSYLADLIDEKSRAVRARVVVDNKAGLLKPGMFATVQLNLKDDTSKKIIAIPEESVFLDGSDRYVFVREGSDKFSARRVSVGPALGEKIEIKEGLKEGDVVVTKGVFTLKSELKKEALQAE